MSLSFSSFWSHYTLLASIPPTDIPPPSLFATIKIGKTQKTLNLCDTYCLIVFYSINSGKRLVAKSSGEPDKDRSFRNLTRILHLCFLLHLWPCCEVLFHKMMRLTINKLHFHQQILCWRPMTWTVLQYGAKDIHEVIIIFQAQSLADPFPCWSQLSCNQDFIVKVIQASLHGLQVTLADGTQQANHLNELTHGTITLKERLSENHFGQDTSGRPNIDFSIVTVTS